MKDKAPPIPVQYGKPYLVSLVKNVNWLYVFWELVPDNFTQAYQELGSTENCRMALRILKGTEPQVIVAEVTVTDNPGSYYLYLAEPGQSYQVQLALINQQRSVTILSSNFVFTPFGKISDLEDSQWAAIDELYRGYANELISSLSSPALWNVSSFELQQKTIKEAEMELTVGTELILYGKTTPGATVYIQGEPITVNSDGSFSLRYALPEGTFIYPIKAVASGGRQTKTTVPVITRETY